MTNSEPRARADNRVLNLLRSTSAVAVVLGHVRLLFIQDYGASPSHGALDMVLYAVTSLGAEAVTVFFVLSGYFVGGGVVARFRRNTFSWFDYGNSRLTRLWLVLIPALLITLIVDSTGRATFGAATAYQEPGVYGGMTANPTLSPLAFFGNMAFLQSLHVPTYGTNNPLWSLAYEAWYYVMFPAVLVLLWRGQRARSRAAGALILIIGVLVTGPDVLLLFPCWLLGALVAAYRKPIERALARANPRRRGLLRLVAVAATAAVAVLVRLDTNLPLRSGAWILAIVTAGLIATFVTDVNWRGAPGRLVSLASSTAHSSYSLYAIHMPFVVLLAAWLVPDATRRPSMTVTSLMMCVGIVVVVWALSYAFARITELRTDRVKAAVERLRHVRPHRPVTAQRPRAH